MSKFRFYISATSGNNRKRSKYDMPPPPFTYILRAGHESHAITFTNYGGRISHRFAWPVIEFANVGCSFGEFPFPSQVHNSYDRQPLAFVLWHVLQVFSGYCNADSEM